MTTKDLLNNLLTPVSTDKLHELYEKIAGPGTPSESEIGEEPLYVQAARSRAEGRNISYEVLLDQYSESLINSNYPTPYCLSPEEVQNYSNGGELLLEQQDHIGTCEQCRELLMSSRPSNDVLAPLMEKVRLLAVRAAGREFAHVADRRSTAQPSVAAVANMFK